MDDRTNTLGGAIWLNLVNTLRYDEGTITDILDAPHLFKGWLEDNDLQENDFNDIQIVKELREIFKRILVQIQSSSLSKLSDGIVALNRMLENIPLSCGLNIKDDTLISQIKPIELKKTLVFKIISSFIETCEKYGLTKLKQCAHDDCILYFLDTSKAGKRKWCDMEVCGNRTKASTFYQKTKGLRYEKENQ